MQKKKVLHIVPWLITSGMESFIFELVTKYDKEMFDTAVIVIEQNIDSLNLERLNKTCLKLFCINEKSSYGPKDGFNIINFIRISYKINKIVKEYKPMIIHSHLWSIKSAIIPAVLNNIPVRIHTLHAGAHIELKNVGVLGRTAFKIFGFIPVAPSGYVRDEMEDKLKYKNMPLIFHGIEVHKYKCSMPREKRDVIKVINVGRLSIEKQQELLVYTFRDICSVCNNIKLFLVGDGPDKDKISELVKKLDLSGKVELLGVRNDIPDLLADSDIFVFPSYREAFGLSLLEAMASGLPVIVSNTGALPEIVENNGNGYLIDTNKPIGLIKAVIKLSQDADLRERMGRRSIELAERFDSQIMAKSYEMLYLKGLNAGYAED